MNAPIAADSTMLEEILTTPDRTSTPVFRSLTAKDRCDSCSAAAKAEFTFTSGTLHLCGHHTRHGLKRLLAGAVEAWIEPAEMWEIPALQAQMEALAAVHRPATTTAARSTDGFV